MSTTDWGARERDDAFFASILTYVVRPPVAKTSVCVVPVKSRPLSPIKEVWLPVMEMSPPVIGKLPVPELLILDTLSNELLLKLAGPVELMPAAKLTADPAKLAEVLTLRLESVRLEVMIPGATRVEKLPTRDATVLKLPDVAIRPPAAVMGPTASSVLVIISFELMMLEELRLRIDPLKEAVRVIAVAKLTSTDVAVIDAALTAFAPLML